MERAMTDKRRLAIMAPVHINITFLMSHLFALIHPKMKATIKPIPEHKTKTIQTMPSVCSPD
jgi:hypothetical protein